MIIQSFKNILAWQKSHQLTLEVYRLTKSFPTHELFALVNQIRRCAVSVPSNIAEGFCRNGKKDSLHFYNISRASLEELKYQLLLSKDLGYINSKEYNQIESMAEEASKTLTGWIKAQRGNDS